MFERAGLFLRHAGTVILGISIVLWFLADLSQSARPGRDRHANRLAHSFAGRAGHALEPVIKPLGFDWHIGIGLISFVRRARSLRQLHGRRLRRRRSTTRTPRRCATRCARPRWPDGAPLFTPLVCLTLMVFYVFAMQCMSTVAVVKRETNGWKWPLFQIAYMTGTAWVVCFIVYQTGRALGY